MSKPVAARCVLEASAILAFLRDEPGAAVVRQALDNHAAVSAVNLSEVLSKMLDKGAAPAVAQHALATLEM